MARPQLHNTEEERINAAWRYRAKYYERNKKAIGLKMAMKYRQKKYDSHSDCAPKPLSTPKLSSRPSISSISSCTTSHKNGIIRDINDAQSKLVVICAELEPLSHRMVHDFQDHREGVQERLSQHLQTLERVHEYLRLETLDADSESSRIAIVAGVMCRCKAILMAAEELWCYSATSEIDEEMIPRFHRRGLLFQTIV
ncbi:hypothetical protein CY34DRAFT_18543 [Suillus luteus UH-Slu-Lm8-n1]|uniref:Uncharacterized protein n=1 Tax=Suillus luteus UH-Slu-Lm8-n1 TaxID=930992 RepID=A0A0D0AG08_9AGAM|nr:hypothetical protein CY34DRAFT_18543 [Suillus luteus UH-Slu-Lm8-n1]